MSDHEPAEWEIETFRRRFRRTLAPMEDGDLDALARRFAAVHREHMSRDTEWLRLEEDFAARYGFDSRYPRGREQRRLAWQFQRTGIVPELEEATR